VHDLKAGDLLDQYRITGLIARGGMASIFKAIDSATGATVAIKVPHLRFESDPAFHARFLREEEIGRRLNHPSIIRVLKPRQKSRVYIVTEYVNGVSLRSLMPRHHPLETEKALGIARQIADGLVYLHSQHVVHRDLKPENILVTGDGKIKILDFGIALDHPGRRLTWLGSSTMGTPEYMAPEQVKGLRGDERSDIYAAGVILYAMLTGEIPFPGETPQAIMQSKLGSDPLPPTSFRPDLHPVLEEIVLHAIERTPGNRYATAVELAADLRDPTRVRPVGRRAALRPRSLGAQRRRWIVTRVVWVLAIILSLVLLVWLANRHPTATYQNRSVGWHPHTAPAGSPVA
jgi:eukaryotic-like serine/threonine-protein kinase